MVNHVALSAEAQAAALLGARERPLVIVNALVDPQVLLLAERFVAAWVGTRKRLCPIMKVHMCSESNLSFEGLLAARVRTREKLVLICLFAGGLPVRVFNAYWLPLHLSVSACPLLAHLRLIAKNPFQSLYRLALPKGSKFLIGNSWLCFVCNWGDGHWD